jgi:hypothetical protein
VQVVLPVALLEVLHLHLPPHGGIAAARALDLVRLLRLAQLLRELRAALVDEEAAAGGVRRHLCAGGKGEERRARCGKRAGTAGEGGAMGSEHGEACAIRGVL